MKVTYIEETIEEQVLVVDAEGSPVLDEAGAEQYETIQVGTKSGEVTGFNRGPTEGESYINIDQTKDMVRGYGYDKWQMYKVVDGTLALKSEAEIAAIEAEAALEVSKVEQEAQIRATYAIDSEAPVEVTIPEGTFTFNGGQDSASYISGAVTLAESLAETSVFITDVDNIKRELSFDSANTVAVLVAKQYRDAFFIKQDALVALANLTTVEGE